MLSISVKIQLHSWNSWENISIAVKIINGSTCGESNSRLIDSKLYDPKVGNILKTFEKAYAKMKYVFWRTVESLVSAWSSWVYVRCCRAVGTATYVAAPTRVLAYKMFPGMPSRNVLSATSISLIFSWILCWFKFKKKTIGEGNELIVKFVYRSICI